MRDDPLRPKLLPLVHLSAPRWGTVTGMDLIPSLFPLAGALIGALTTLFGIWLSSRLGRQREARAAMGEAIVGLIEAWGHAYEKVFAGESGRKTLQTGAGVAVARLLVLVPRRDTEGISKIVNATTNSLADPRAAAFVGCAQDSLLEWHAIRSLRGTDAFELFKRKMSDVGVGLP